MTKKDFKKLIDEHKDIFRCLVLNDATIRYGHPHTSIEICWNANNNARTVVKNMRGKQTDLKCIDELEKYKAWMA
mgnify:CR=1 FL=1|tara:strand:+ start:123 stop:347 length:225 start_codon:yes stop_codon:yes gene_type:complete